MTMWEKYRNNKKVKSKHKRNTKKAMRRLDVKQRHKDAANNPQLKNMLKKRMIGNLNPMSNSEIRKKHSKAVKRKSYIKKLRDYQNQPEVKRKFKERRKTMIIPTKDTSIEVKIQNFLKQLGIEYFTHQYMKIKHGYQCDVLIPSMNMVIECDGDYWHKYPVGNDIDHVRTKELIKKGFKVLRLWEFEINKMTINEFEKRVKKNEI